MIKRAGGASQNLAKLSRSTDHTGSTRADQMAFKMAGVRRPASRDIRSDAYQVYRTGHFNPRAAASNGAVQRGS